MIYLLKLKNENKNCSFRACSHISDKYPTFRNLIFDKIVDLLKEGIKPAIATSGPTEALAPGGSS